MSRTMTTTPPRLSTRLALGCALVLAMVTSTHLGAQTAQTRQVMREKLDRAELLLAGLVTSNWASLDREARALDALTNKPGWDVFRNPEYVRQTGTFHVAAQSLIDAAAQRDQQTVLKAYTGLVSSCVACHQYVARARVARAEPAPPAPQPGH